MKTPIYLDHAAATPMDPRVLKAMEPFFAKSFHNPSAIYLAAKNVHTNVEEARATVAKILGARSPEIIFTSGGTEANNLALLGVARQYKGSHIVSTVLEHESVLAPLDYLEAHGWQVSRVKPTPEGIIDPCVITKAITDETVLISVMYANNEIGTIQPLKQIANEISKIRTARKLAGNDLPLYFHTDAAQASNYLNLLVKSLGVDMMTLNGGKIYGPKQSGVLYVNSQVKLEPIIFGGGQERGLRSGTENVAGIIGFSRALEIAQTMRDQESTRLKQLQQIFIKQLQKDIPSAHINGSTKTRLPNNIHLTIPGQDNERLLFALDEMSIQVAAGSACSASNEEASHVLLAIGLSEAEARASLRLTMGRGTTEVDIRRVVSALAKIC